MIADKIKRYLETDFEKELFQASLENFSATTNKLRFNNFAYAVRELTRHFLKRLAPDSEIEKCVWYKNETGEAGKISRGERIRYAVQGGLNTNYVVNTLGINVRQTNTEFSRIVKLLSKYTHIESHTFNTESSQADQYKKKTLETLLEFFELIDESKKEVVFHLKSQIDEELFSRAISETHQEIDLVATHHYIEDVEIYEHEVDNIDSETIHITAYGNLETTLEYGSASDHRNGDGASLSHTFPFSCAFTSSVARPRQILDSAPSLNIDESSWYGDE